MSVPARRGPRYGSTKWDAVRDALDSNAKMLRLCAIVVTVTVSLTACAILAPHLLALLALL
jgi:hypothetical protein